MMHLTQPVLRPLNLSPTVQIQDTRQLATFMEAGREAAINLCRKAKMISSGCCHNKFFMRSRVLTV